MRIKFGELLSEFKFWGPAKERAANLTMKDFSIIQRHFADAYPDGIDHGDLNDIFAYNFDWVVQLLGYENEEDFDEKRGL